MNTTQPDYASAQWKQEHLSCELLPIINDFFDRYEQEECEREIWNLVTTLSGLTTEYADSNSLANSVFFCRNVNFLIKKLYIVWKTSYNNLTT